MKSWCGTIRDKLSVMIFRVLGEKAASRLPPCATPAASSGNCPAGPEAEKNSPHSRSVGYPFLAIVDTAPIACAAASMKLLTVRLSVCLSVRPSVPSFGCSTLLRRVCCCGPGIQEISIDCYTAGAQQQRMRAVSRCQLT